MATRFYLPNGAVAPGMNAAVLPPFDSSWENTATAVRYRCVTEKKMTGMGNPLGTGHGVNPSDTLRIQYVSDPIAAQVISGTVKGQIACNEDADTYQMMPQFLAKIVSFDGQTERGILYAHQTEAITNEFATLITNRKFPRNWAGSGATLSSVTALSEDRIVLELGIRQESTATTFFRLYIGDNNPDDLPENETETGSSFNPWIEFSQNIGFIPRLSGRRLGSIFR